MKQKHKGSLGSHKLEYVIVPIVFLLIWYWLGKQEHANALIIPPITKMVHTLEYKLLDGSLLEALGVSIVRVLKGYVLAVVLGISIGIMVGLSEHMQRLLDLTIQILKPIPPIAWIPLAILWFGIGEGSKVFLIFLGGFFVILLNVVDGIRFRDERYVEVAKVAGISKFQFLVQVVIPGALPCIFTGLRVGINTCWTCVVAAELVASTSGIGYMISNARNYGQMDVILVGMFAIGLVGKGMDVWLSRIEKKAIHWKN